MSAGQSRKSIWERLGAIKVSRVHVIMMDFIIWGRLTRPRGPFRAQGSALTRNVARSHGSKNLLQRAILHRHKMIYDRQGRLQARTRRNYVYICDGFFEYLRIGQFVWARVLCGTRYYHSASMDCSGTIQKIHMRKIQVSQGVLA